MVNQSFHKFEDFLFEMDDALEAFIDTARNSGVALDYSLSSTAALEDYLRQADGKVDGVTLNRASRYLGEVFRRHIGGKWELCIKDKNYLYFNLPVISGYSDMSIEFCPIQVVTNFLAKREPGMLLRAVESHQRFKRPRTE